MINDFLRFNGETFDRVLEQSEFSHIWTLGLANYRGKALTTGCNSFGECSLKTELLDMDTLRVVFKRESNKDKIQYLIPNLKPNLRWSAGPDFESDYLLGDDNKK